MSDVLIWINKSGKVLKYASSVIKLFGTTDVEVGKNIFALFPFLKSQFVKGMDQGKFSWRPVKGRALDLEVSFSTISTNGAEDYLVMINKNLITYNYNIDKPAISLEQRNYYLEEKVAKRTKELSKTVSKLLSANKKMEQVVIEKERVTAALQKSEQELRTSLHKEKMLGELKSRFVTTASHEFRTPLSNILSAAEICQLLLSKDETLKIPRHLTKISKSVENLTVILEEFLALSKLEEGHQTVKFEDASMMEIVNHAIEAIEPSLKREQTIEVITKNKQQRIVTDVNILSQILTNLFSNASKYSKEKSKIVCTFNQVGHDIEIAIIDQGMGIPASDVPHLFGKFFRAKNAINVPGTGLGLNLVTRFLELINGQIKVKSILNKGTTFTITLIQKLN